MSFNAPVRLAARVHRRRFDENTTVLYLLAGIYPRTTAEHLHTVAIFSRVKLKSYESISGIQLVSKQNIYANADQEGIN